MTVKKKIDELKSAEEKYQSLIEKRDEYNSQAQTVRQERDALNDKKKELRQEMDALRDRRHDLSDRIGDHKKKRDELQGKAKSMIEMKKKLRSSLDKDTKTDLLTMKREMRKLEMEQQTIPIPLEEEAELLKRIKKLYEQVSDLEKQAKEQKEIQFEVKDVDDAIDEAFELANQEHRQLMIHVTERKEIDEKIKGIVNDIGVVIATANKKHQEFLDIRLLADAQHAKAIELRDKILEIRAAKRKERDEQRRLISEVNAGVKRELLDKQKLEKAADGALEKLLSKGKIEL